MSFPSFLLQVVRGLGGYPSLTKEYFRKSPKVEEIRSVVSVQMLCRV